MNGNNSSYLIILSMVAIVAIVSLVLINNNKVGIESKNVGGLAVKPSIENKEYQTNNLMIETKLIDKDKLKFIVKGDINQSNEEELRKFYFSAINEFETFLEGDEIFSKIDKKTLINELKKQGDPRVLGTGDVFESYPRFGAMRNFPGFKERGKYNPAYLNGHEMINQDN